MAKDTVSKLCGVLAEGKVSATRLAAALGAVLDDGGGNLPVSVKPHDEHFKKALVLRRWPGDQVHYVELVPADGAAARAAFVEELGAAEEAAGSLTFRHGGCLVVAALDEAGAVTAIDVR